MKSFLPVLKSFIASNEIFITLTSNFKHEILKGIYDTLPADKIETLRSLSTKNSELARHNGKQVYIGLQRNHSELTTKLKDSKDPKFKENQRLIAEIEEELKPYQAQTDKIQKEIDSLKIKADKIKQEVEGETKEALEKEPKIQQAKQNLQEAQEKMVSVANNVKSEIIGDEDQNPYSQYLTKRQTVLDKAFTGEPVPEELSKYTGGKTFQFPIDVPISTEDSYVYHFSELIAFATALEKPRDDKQKQRLIGALTDTANRLKTTYPQDSGKTSESDEPS